MLIPIYQCWLEPLDFPKIKGQDQLVLIMNCSGYKASLYVTLYYCLLHTVRSIWIQIFFFFKGLFILSWHSSAAFLLHTVAARQPAIFPLRLAILINRNALGEHRPPLSSSSPHILWLTTHTSISWNTFSKLVCHHILPAHIRRLASVKGLLITGYNYG